MNYSLNEEKMFMDISDGIAVIINSETGIYYGMNELGTEVLDALIKGAAVEKIKQTLAEMKGAPSDMDSKVDSFIRALIDNEIIISGNAAGDAGYSFDEKIALDNEFILDLQLYDDAQEMLLSDPIHEVKEDTGWTPEKDSIGYSKEETREREKKVR